MISTTLPFSRIENAVRIYLALELGEQTASSGFGRSNAITDSCPPLSSSDSSDENAIMR